MSQSLCVISTKAPYTGQSAREALDAVMVAASFEIPVSLLLMGDGVFQLLQKQQPELLPRAEVVEKMFPYIEKQLKNGTHLSHISRHMLGLYQGIPGGRRYRRHISENAHKPGAGIEVLQEAVALVEQ